MWHISPAMNHANTHRMALRQAEAMVQHFVDLLARKVTGTPLVEVK